MKTLRLAVTLLAVSLLPLSAQTPPPLETMGLAGQLLDVMEVDKSMKATMDQVQSSQQQLLSAFPAGVREKAEKAIAAAVKESGLDWPSLRPVFVEIYASTFSAGELQGMIDFFKTPVGQKWIQKQPEVQAKTAEKMQKIMLEAQPKIMEAAQKALRE